MLGIQDRFVARDTSTSDYHEQRQIPRIGAGIASSGFLLLMGKLPHNRRITLGDQGFRKSGSSRANVLSLCATYGTEKLEWLARFADSPTWRQAAADILAKREQ